MRKVMLILFSFLVISPVFNSLSSAVAVSAPVILPASEPSPEAIKSAVNEFFSLSKKEQKKKLKQLKIELKKIAEQKKQGEEPDTNTILLVILAILVPPLAVYLHQGEFNTKFWIALVLWLLGLVAFGPVSWLALLPSIVYAILVIMNAI